jgi:23S rRNA (pseudouridine1915-N3)-methyltransferase
LKLVVLAVGKIRERHLREAADDYLKRLQRYARCDEIEVRDTAALERAIPGDAVVIALMIDGEAVGSEVFANKLEKWASRGKGIVAFLIGGAEGLPPELARRADTRLSLSSLTLPHRLARVVLFEQLYRAMTILRGEPYAREG